MTDLAEKIPSHIRWMIRDDDEVYVHPQGATILVRDGRVEKFKPDGKHATTTATAQKLREGHGRWQRVFSVGASALPPGDQPASNDIDDVLAWLDHRSDKEGW